MKKGKVLVTGANRGIGFGICKHLGLAGWQVVVGARDEQRAQKAMAELKQEGIDVAGWEHIDLCDNESLKRSAQKIRTDHPDLSLLVNNAGIPGNMAVNSYDSDLADVVSTVQVNYVGTFVLTSQLIPLLAENHGRIVNITVPSPVSPYWHPMAYVASKAAQNAMTGVMALDFEKNHVPVEIFDIHPGATTTDLNNHYTGLGSHSVDVVADKIERTIDDGQSHQGEFIELYPIVDEGN
jgi:NAD(P)-dependent dehydrogenase (short-subunit alcohol dehydrogenase family)